MNMTAGNNTNRLAYRNVLYISISPWPRRPLGVSGCVVSDIYTRDCEGGKFDIGKRVNQVAGAIVVQSGQ